jgi:hypothetical protein
MSNHFVVTAKVLQTGIKMAAPTEFRVENGGKALNLG